MNQLFFLFCLDGYFLAYMQNSPDAITDTDVFCDKLLNKLKENVILHLEILFMGEGDSKYFIIK